jgi:carbon-monoxide dehydrogenase large subunit
MTTSPVAGRFVGESVPRVEDARVLTGRGRYTDDIKLPGMLHAAFVRSPFPHARITSIDVEAARAMPGVVDVLTGEDIKAVTAPIQVMVELPTYQRPVFHPLATDAVRYVGDPVALVVAESRYEAEDARDAVEVDYDPLEPVATIEHARDSARPLVFGDVESNVTYSETMQFGDPDAAFAGARVVRETFRSQRVAHVPMEGRAGIADYRPGTDELTYYAANQAPNNLRFSLSMLLQHPTEKLRVVAPDIGGAFGQKAATFREDICVCAASRRLGRPVKWIDDRIENMTSASHAREEDVEIAVAFDDEGTILGLDVKMTLDQGAYPLPGLPSPLFGWIMRTMIANAYRIENLRWALDVVTTNKASYGAYRGPWAAETLVREIMLERVAREVGLEIDEIRRRNLVRPDEQPRKMLTGPTLEGVTSLASVERAAELIGLAALREEQRRARDEGRLLGVGFSTYIEPAPGPPDYWASIGFPIAGERAYAKLEPNGHLTVISQQVPNGQGHETTIAQIAATEFGVPLDHVRVVFGDTNTMPFSMLGTGGSRSATMASGSSLSATRAVKQKVLALAGTMLEIAPDDLEIVDATVTPKGAPGRGLALAELAAAAYFAPPEGEEPGLPAVANFLEPPGGWSGGTHACVVEVDPETGVVEIVRYLVVEDCGALINPAIVDGQVRGGVAQGIGLALYEHANYDEDGNFLAASFMDYLVPTAMEIPRIEIEHLHGEELHEVAYRGVGEGGTIAAPAAVVNAVADALGGAQVNELPLTPERVLGLVDAMRDGS